MPSERDKAKRWQFGLGRLLALAAIAPLVLSLAFGGFGADIALGFWFWLVTTVVVFVVAYALYALLRFEETGQKIRRHFVIRLFLIVAGLFVVFVVYTAATN